VQTYKGLDVLLSEVELRISNDGRLMAFGSDCYRDFPIATTPVLSPAAAARAATAGLPVSANDVTTRSDGRLFILPVTDNYRTQSHLVYEVLLERSSPPGVFVAFVDAADGTLLWRHNRVRYLEIHGKAEGTVQLVLPTDPFVTRPFGSQDVMLGTLHVVTDSLGLFATDLGAPATLSTRLSGPFVNVNRDDAPDALISTTVNPGDSVTIRWDDTNAHPAERDGFFHTNVIHDFITTLDSQFTEISYSMPCVVNINQTCNAFWNGTGINFFREGGGCPNTAQMPDVVYHEYGHGINDKLYEQLGRSFGMINGATHEGMADVAASVILDDPRVGRGFFGPGTILRSIWNNNTYPANVSSDPHITGLILAGAFWDIRVATSLETMRMLSHFAKYGLPDDPNDGVAFSEWFVETLVADDDDGNLANGTPHSEAILAAFNAHGIGATLYFRQSFSHTPLPSTDDTTQAYTAVFSLGGIPGTTPDSVQLIYSVDGFASAVAVAAQQVLPSSYQASIPPQPGGSVVRYYISAHDPVGSATYVFPPGAPQAGSYRFMVGRQPAAAGVLYAATTGAPSGRLYRLDTASGTATLIGPLGIPTVHALTVHPVTKELYAFSGGPASARMYRVSPTFGDAFEVGEVPVPNLRAAAFAGGDTLFSAAANSRLYRSVLGDTASVGAASGLFYASLAFHPVEGTLWASVRPPVGFRDRIYTVNRETGQVTLVGATGDNLPTPALAFSPGGSLYALKGLSTQINTLLSINTSTGAGTAIGSAGVSGLVTLAMSGDSIATTIGPEAVSLPPQYALEQNYPNPFNGETRIRYRIEDTKGGGRVTLKVFDILGREVKTLVDGRQSPGLQTVAFDATDLPSGVYVYRLQVSAGEDRRGAAFTQVRKMLLLK